MKRDADSKADNADKKSKKRKKMAEAEDNFESSYAIYSRTPMSSTVKSNQTDSTDKSIISGKTQVEAMDRGDSTPSSISSGNAPSPIAKTNKTKKSKQMQPDDTDLV